MKTRLLVLCAALTIVIGLVACSPAPSGASIEIPCGDFLKMSSTPAVISRDIQVPINGTLTIALCSNASTGFKWQDSAQIGDQKVVSQTDHQTVAPASGSPPGAAGKEVWTFQALKNGTTSVSMEYGRPWVGGEKGAWKFNLTVTVKQ